ncbi:MAG: type I-U CRISPR-associated protein Csb2, partial [Thermoanaerobaculum sp.]|nr:type I-U CRISPR-associated protein Csb2 [Thermoanaerobaculum sp.]
MDEYLVLTVRFFDARVHARSSSGEPEWPPAPFRLFQALLAGAGQAGGPTSEEREALGWLERQPPPSIRAPSF